MLAISDETTLRKHPTLQMRYVFINISNLCAVKYTIQFKYIPLGIKRKCVVNLLNDCTVLY